MNFDSDNPKWKILGTVHFHCQQAADYALTAQTLESRNLFPDNYTGFAVESLGKAAIALGYTLVKREYEQEAA